MNSQLWTDDRPASGTTSITDYSPVPTTTMEGEASRTDSPVQVQLDVPNEETVSAMEDARAGRVEAFATLEDLLSDLRS